ncbi:heavy metal-associated isoprenylated plant protein 21 isoform X1 [Nicotiana tabacum]|uniref:Heavy metal-associated isoprenylated plant protein 21 isoform X1 n=1 Tax=Nicotiana tabacum TaxID=4097 RepID=A0AC58SNC8_TOBAC|nr:heavy metal-associated isoprenylated plant protein 21-like isoform X1 [Nicotiana tomentosiformis]
MGVMDHIVNFFTITTNTNNKKKSMQTVEIKVKMDCDGCERRVKNSVKYMKVSCVNELLEVGISGVKTVEVNRKQSKVTVNGYVDPNRVLNRIKSTGKRAEFWPYVPYNVVYYPHAPQAYDKRAPAGMVKNVAQAQLPPNATEEEKFAYLFSDDNPSACSIM